MPYLTELSSYISFDNEMNQNITIKMEIESGKSATTIVPVNNHLDAFVDLINNDIESIILGYNVNNQVVIDQLIKSLPQELGRKIPNEILFSLSITAAKLAAEYNNMELYRYLSGPRNIVLPQVVIKKEVYDLHNLNESKGMIKQVSSIEMVKDDLANLAFLDLYSINQTTINNLKKKYPNLMFISKKKLEHSYQYFDIYEYQVVSDVLNASANFINTKYLDSSLADLSIALKTEYLYVNNNVLNRLLNILNEEK